MKNSHETFLVIFIYCVFLLIYNKVCQDKHLPVRKFHFWHFLALFRNMCRKLVKLPFWRKNSNIYNFGAKIQICSNFWQLSLTYLNFRAKNGQNRIFKCNLQFWRDNSNISVFDNFTWLIWIFFAPKIAQIASLNVPNHHFWRENSNISNFDNIAWLIWIFAPKWKNIAT